VVLSLHIGMKTLRYHRFARAERTKKDLAGRLRISTAFVEATRASQQLSEQRIARRWHRRRLRLGLRVALLQAFLFSISSVLLIFRKSPSLRQLVEVSLQLDSHRLCFRRSQESFLASWVVALRWSSNRTWSTIRKVFVSRRCRSTAQDRAHYA